MCPCSLQWKQLSAADRYCCRHRNPCTQSALLPVKRGTLAQATTFAIIPGEKLVAPVPLEHQWRNLGSLAERNAVDQMQKCPVFPGRVTARQRAPCMYLLMARAGQNGGAAHPGSLPNLTVGQKVSEELELLSLQGESVTWKAVFSGDQPWAWVANCTWAR